MGTRADGRWSRLRDFFTFRTTVEDTFGMAEAAVVVAAAVAVVAEEAGCGAGGPDWGGVECSGQSLSLLVLQPTLVSCPSRVFRSSWLEESDPSSSVCVQGHLPSFTRLNP